MAFSCDIMIVVTFKCFRKYCPVLWYRLNCPVCGFPGCGFLFAFTRVSQHTELGYGTTNTDAKRYEKGDSKI